MGKITGQGAWRLLSRTAIGCVIGATLWSAAITASGVRVHETDFVVNRLNGAGFADLTVTTDAELLAPGVSFRPIDISADGREMAVIEISKMLGVHVATSGFAKRGFVPCGQPVDGIPMSRLEPFMKACVRAAMVLDEDPTPHQVAAAKAVRGDEIMTPEGRVVTPDGETLCRLIGGRPMPVPGQSVEQFLILRPLCVAVTQSSKA